MSSTARTIVSLPSASPDRLPKALSARWETELAQFEKALREGDVLPQHAVTLAVSLNGVLAPRRDGDAQEKRKKTAEEGRLTRGPAGYREDGFEAVNHHVRSHLCGSRAAWIHGGGRRAPLWSELCDICATCVT